MSEETGKGLSNVVRIDEDQIRDHLGKIVRGSVEESGGDAERAVGRGGKPVV